MGTSRHRHKIRSVFADTAVLMPQPRECTTRVLCPCSFPMPTLERALSIEPVASSASAAGAYLHRFDASLRLFALAPGTNPPLAIISCAGSCVRARTIIAAAELVRNDEKELPRSKICYETALIGPHLLVLGDIFGYA